MRTHHRGRLLLASAVAVAVLATSGCVEKTVVEQSSATTAPPSYGGERADGPTVVSQFPGVEASFGKLPAEATAAGPDNPIVVGMINQENTPLGSFPEIRLAAEAAVDVDQHRARRRRRSAHEAGDAASPPSRSRSRRPAPRRWCRRARSP